MNETLKAVLAKVAVGVLLAIIVGSATMVLSHESRLTAEETATKYETRQLERIEGKIDELLRRSLRSE